VRSLLSLTRGGLLKAVLFICSPFSGQDKKQMKIGIVMVPNAFEIVSGITGKYIYKTFQIVFFCSYYCQLYLKKK
jgi:hypothetical protein